MDCYTNGGIYSIYSSIQKILYQKKQRVVINLIKN